MTESVKYCQGKLIFGLSKITKTVNKFIYNHYKRRGEILDGIKLHDDEWQTNTSEFLKQRGRVLAVG